MKQNQKGKRDNITTGLLVLIIIVGLSLVLYPTVSDWWNSFHQSRAVAGYVEKVEDLSVEEKEQIYEDAVQYNEKLAQKRLDLKLTDEEKKEYNSLLNFNGNGIMGYIDIPEIGVQLPIYHGTDKAVLQIAVGHIEGTSLPVGGIGTHAVISGHRGLPSAKLFSDLDKLRSGDIFMIRVLDHIITYEVDQILIVEPNQTEALVIDPDQDYCTLVTCTPYGVNSHRLLVRGHRIENIEESNTIRVTADATQIDPILMAPLLAAPLLLSVGIFWIVDGLWKKKKANNSEQKKQI